MSAEAVMILMPIAVLVLGLSVLLIAYIGSVRTPVEATPPASSDGNGLTRSDIQVVRRLSEQLERLMEPSTAATAPPRPVTPPRPAAPPAETPRMKASTEAPTPEFADDRNRA